MSKIKKLFILFLISLIYCVGLTIFSINSVKANTIIKPPLSTQGNQIIDATGKAVLLRGVNWFGMEIDVHVPHGLWVRDYKDMLGQIKKLGYNIIRLPYSVNALRSNNISAVDFNIGSNRDLQGKTPLQVMDLIIQEANKQGLFILLDSHRLNDNSIPELWYGDGFTEADWINTWTMLAQRYKNQPNVIGADLKNEPHGRASWGTNDQATDWRLAAERAGNAILKVNPNWLILVEGVEKNVPNQKLSNYWWGANLEGVKSYPVRLSNPKKLVYSPHEYGQGVYDQPYFHIPEFPQNLAQRWETGFNYISTQKIAPIFVGEFGGRKVDNSSKEGIWQRTFIDYIAKNNLSFTYWSWNPNSGDTGGILQDDWRSIHNDKQQLLSKLLSSTTITPTANPTVNPTQNTGSLKVESLIDSNWDQGFCLKFIIINQSKNDTRNWHLKFTMNQAKINKTWNGNFQQKGSQYTVTVPDWARIIKAGQKLDSIGFCANKEGKDYLPKQVSAILLLL